MVICETSRKKMQEKGISVQDFQFKEKILMLNIVFHGVSIFVYKQKKGCNE